MAALRAAVFPLSAKNRRGGHFLPPPPPVRLLREKSLYARPDPTSGTGWPIYERSSLFDVTNHHSINFVFEISSPIPAGACHGPRNPLHRVGNSTTAGPIAFKFGVCLETRAASPHLSYESLLKRFDCVSIRSRLARSDVMFMRSMFSGRLDFPDLVAMFSLSAPSLRRGSSWKSLLCVLGSLAPTSKLSHAQLPTDRLIFAVRQPGVCDNHVRSWTGHVPTLSSLLQLRSYSSWA